MNTQIKEKIIQHFINYKKIWAVLSLKAEIDLDVIVWVDDVYEFYQFWNKTLDEFEDYFAKYTISLYVEAFNYKKSYLLPDENHKADRLLYRTKCAKQPAVIDEIDYKILDEIAINARIPLMDPCRESWLFCSNNKLSNKKSDEKWHY